ncbi:MAG: serine/threonine protein kinase [Gemmataceae bacterium]|nr:serine/threonine protein kinase [Gemmataceae bacterium]MCI0737771.1 serine/threonine protein kinase [Gemmataceae bacterium]
MEGEPFDTTVVGDVASPQKPAAAPSEQLAELVGQMLGNYQILSVIAKGHSGTIFQAKDTKKDQIVAFKVLWAEFTQDEESMARFVRAMSTMLPVKHPNLVAILGAGRTGDYCWMAMEYVDGESLTQVIKRIGVAGMLDWRYALRVGVHVGRALEYAHGQHIIHRNITPANILYRPTDKIVKLGDLMLAKALEGNKAQEITRPGTILGDVPYMSPERTRVGLDVDGRSDIYSLGATMYALLTGRPPYDAKSLPELIAKIRKDEPEKPKKYQLSIPDLLEGTVLRMLSKRPEDRYQTATDMLVDLDRVAKFQGVQF